MLNEWSLDPKLIIKYHEMEGFPKLTKLQKCRLYICCYVKDLKNWITRYK